MTLDLDAYQNYSPLFLPTTFAFAYALSFGGLTSILVHTALSHGREIIKKVFQPHSNDEDIHGKLYRIYPEVPDWWYYILFGLMMALSIVVCEAWDTRLPWWGFLVTQAIPFIFTLPIGMLQAITNTQLGKCK